jgi:hypothetical protein
MLLIWEYRNGWLGYGPVQRAAFCFDKFDMSIKCSALADLPLNALSGNSLFLAHKEQQPTDSLQMDLPSQEKYVAAPQIKSPTLYLATDHDRL